MNGEPGGTVRHPSTLGRSPGGRRPLRARLLPLGGVVAGVAVLAGVLGFGLSRAPGIIRSPLVGRPAPDFALTTLDGQRTVRLSDLRGQVVVVNFWASWCRECRVEHPALAGAWDRYRDRGVVFLGITFQDPPSASRAYLEELGGGWPVLEDPGSVAAIAFGVYGVPETFVIGRDGRVSDRYLGAIGYERLVREIDRMLREA
jgi:cytochrome c biogenesis protein CcmG, thiol:disulfide interchange protein DsbE